MKNFRDMTINELLESGASVDVGYYGNRRSKEQAENIIDNFDLPYREIKKDGFQWLKGKEHVGEGELTVDAFYEKEDHSTEYAQAALTEQERKMKEAGVKESDFL